MKESGSDAPNAVSAIEMNSMPQKRPFGVTLLLWMVLSLSAWGSLRLIGALRWWDVLTHFQARLSPWYLSITGASWTVAGIVLLWSVFVGKRWAYPAIPASVALWLVQYWLERIFFEAPRANLPFMIVVTLFLLVVTVTITFSQRTKNFLLRSEEHEQPK